MSAQQRRSLLWRWLALLVLAGCAGTPASGRSTRRADTPLATSRALRAPRDCSSYDTDPEYRDWSTRARYTSRTACELNNELYAFIAERKACRTADDCMLFDTACPFGCGVAVAREHGDELSHEYEKLSERFARVTGAHCKYKCFPVTTACDAGRCVEAGLPAK